MERLDAAGARRVGTLLILLDTWYILDELLMPTAGRNLEVSTSKVRYLISCPIAVPTACCNNHTFVLACRW